jgi:hypothetical protein
MLEQSIEEVRKLIFVSFSEEEKLSIDDIIRLWSLELQWMEPEEASIIVDKLIESGWLKQEENQVSPIINVKEIHPDLGWQPMLRLLLSPPTFNFESNTNDVEKIEIKSEIVVEIKESKQTESTRNYPPDRSEHNIPNLIKYIANKSKIENREVVRKRRSLGAVTLWMALALVAREQGLDMVEVSSLIEPV